VFGILFWIFLGLGLVIALVGFTSIYTRSDDQDRRH
jgi:hypothetical protein